MTPGDARETVRERERAFSVAAAKTVNDDAASAERARGVYTPATGRRGSVFSRWGREGEGNSNDARARWRRRKRLRRHDAVLLMNLAQYAVCFHFSLKAFLSVSQRLRCVCSPPSGRRTAVSRVRLRRHTHTQTKTNPIKRRKCPGTSFYCSRVPLAPPPHTFRPPRFSFSTLVEITSRKQRTKRFQTR